MNLFLICVTVGYSSRDVLYKWNPKRTVKIASDMRMSQFDLTSFHTGNVTGPIRTGMHVKVSSPACNHPSSLCTKAANAWNVTPACESMRFTGIIDQHHDMVSCQVSVTGIIILMIPALIPWWVLFACFIISACKQSFVIIANFPQEYVCIRCQPPLILMLLFRGDHYSNCSIINC